MGEQLEGVENGTDDFDEIADVTDGPTSYGPSVFEAANGIKEVIKSKSVKLPSNIIGTKKAWEEKRRWSNLN